jgi:hypothetical protein
MFADPYRTCYPCRPYVDLCTSLTTIEKCFENHTLFNGFCFPPCPTNFSYFNEGACYNDLNFESLLEIEDQKSFGRVLLSYLFISTFFLLLSSIYIIKTRIKYKINLYHLFIVVLNSAK